MAAQLSDGDWVEGAPQWWWRYVFPARDIFWSTVLATVYRLDPQPSPWRQQIGELLEGIAMLSSASKVTEPGIAERLSKDAISKINGAAAALQKVRAK